MKEDLKHIDLIDKYLNGTLNETETEQVEILLRENPEFVKEVAVFKKLYQGIEQGQEAQLKQRLGTYLQEYEQEFGNSQKAKGKYRKLLTYGGAIAACFIIGGAVFFFNKLNPQNQIKNDPEPVVVDVDTVITKKTDSIIDVNEEILVQEELPKKSNIDSIPEDQLTNNENEKGELQNDSLIIPQEVKNVELALVGYKKLPSESVRYYNYKKTLSYTFDNDRFKLYGDPLVGNLELMSLRIIKNKKSDYLLSLKNTYYAIEETTKRKQLSEVKKESGNNGFSSFFKKSSKLIPTKEEVSLDVVNMHNDSYMMSGLVVKYQSDQSISNTYFFNQKEGEKELIINALINPEKANVYRIQEDGDFYYFLVQENDIYALQADAKEPTPLIQTNITTNKLARLFIPREPVKTSIYKMD